MNSDSAMTLREGLARYYRSNAGVCSQRDLSPAAAEFFRCHDVAHVVFGCDTTLYGEGVVKIYTIFGTTLGLWKHLRGYSDASAWRLFTQYRLSHVLTHLWRLITHMPVAMLRARRMTRPWPWADHEQYLDQTLDAIRQEFNIAVMPMR